MKAKLIRDMPAADAAPDEWVANINGKRVCEAGLVFEHPEAFWQVLQGNALPADEECDAEVTRRRTKPQLEVARQAMDELLELQASGSPEDDDDDDGDDE